MLSAGAHPLQCTEKLGHYIQRDGGWRRERWWEKMRKMIQEGRKTGKIRMDREEEGREKMRRREREAGFTYIDASWMCWKIPRIALNTHTHTHTHTHRWQGKENVINNHSGKRFTAKCMHFLPTLCMWMCVCVLACAYSVLSMSVLIHVHECTCVCNTAICLYVCIFVYVGFACLSSSDI